MEKKSFDIISAIILFILAIYSLIQFIAGIAVSGLGNTPTISADVLLYIIIIPILFTIVSIVTGIFLIKQKNWARITALVIFSLVIILSLILKPFQRQLIISVVGLIFAIISLIKK